MKTTVLVADNNPEFLALTKERLEQHGYKVISVSTPEQARLILENVDVSLAVLDLRLTSDDDTYDISGLEVAKNTDPNIPKIILSRYPTSVVWLGALKANIGLSPAVDVVNKAEGFKGLLEAIRRKVDGTRPEGAIIHPLRVFLCHSSIDKPKVRQIHDRLRALGMDPWLDKEKLLPGQDWEYEIKKAVRNSDVVIVCLSQSSVSKRGFIQKEIRLALDAADQQPDGTMFIIPLKLEECEIPERLRQWHWVNYWEDNAHEKLMLALKHRASEISSRY